MSLSLVYWPIRARNMLAVAIADHANLGLELEQTFEWPGSLKSQAQFGQLPALRVGDKLIVQSCAIARFLARKAGLQGDNDDDFATSEMLIEEFVDVFNNLAKINYSEDKVNGYNQAFGAGGLVPTQLGYLENLLKGDFFASKVTAGDLAVVCLLNVLVSLEPTALDAFPKLKAFYERMSVTPAFARIFALPLYFKRS
eukprot:GILI01000193.1.p1 GENE.GILI01000193.1~~GILI01000193.1.p1  ORF type:complete len:215 (+),score=83.41 GILI01000193.1:52-645(+)